MESEKGSRWRGQLCADGGLHDDSPPPHRCFLLPTPTAFHSVPLFCFCICSGDSFKDTNMPPHPPCSPPSLSCCPLAVIANICLTRCSFAFVNILSSFKYQINMILPLSFQIPPCSHMPDQISCLQTHARLSAKDPEAGRSRSPRPAAPRPPPSWRTYRAVDTLTAGSG